LEFFNLKVRSNLLLKFFSLVHTLGLLCSITVIKLAQPLWKIVWRLHKKLKTELSYDPPIPLLGVFPKKMELVSQRDFCFVCSAGVKHRALHMLGKHP
jgi:hypothetical protein